MKINRKKVFIGIISLLIIGVVGVFFYQKSNWKTYSNEEVRISFQYPSLWKQPVFSPSTPRTYSGISFNLGTTSSFDINIAPVTSDMYTGGSTSMETLAEDEYINATTQYSDLKSDQKKLDFTLSGHKAILVSYIFHPAGGTDLTPSQHTTMVISAGDRIIMISYYYLLDKFSEDQQSKIDKIVSSLKIGQ